MSIETNTTLYSPEDTQPIEIPTAHPPPGLTKAKLIAWARANGRTVDETLPKQEIYALLGALGGDQGGA